MVSTPPSSSDAACQLSSSEFAPDPPEVLEEFANIEKYMDPDVLDASFLQFDTFLNPSQEPLGSCDPFDIPKEMQDADESQNTSQPSDPTAADTYNSSENNVAPADIDYQGQVVHMNNQPAYQPQFGPNFPDLIHQDYSEYEDLQNLNDNSMIDQYGMTCLVPVQASYNDPVPYAFPGSNSFTTQPPLNHLQYPDPSYPTYPTEPYYADPIQYGIADIPVDPQMQVSFVGMPQQPSGNNTYESGQQWSLQDLSYALVDNGEGQVEFSPHSDQDIVASSDEESPTSDQEIPLRSYTPDYDSEDSSEDSLINPVNPPVLRAGEKPQKCSLRTWVRPNNTKGQSIRTARINRDNGGKSQYNYRPLPHSDGWEYGKMTFEYVTHEEFGLDELEKPTMTTKEIYTYITKYPGKNLRLWIQVTPTDNARRYASESHSQCLFQDCPVRTWLGRGTIEKGHYRVAFDEKHKVYGNGAVSPFDCTAYAHLYCMERFLDFPRICRMADVKVDTRNDLKKEKNGEGPFIFGKKRLAEKNLAERFVKTSGNNQLRRTPEFANYPFHAKPAKGEPKPYKQTLTYAMFQTNWEGRPRSQKRQFVVDRDVKPGAFAVHLGDLEIQIVDKKVQAEKDFKDLKKTGEIEDIDLSQWYDRFNPDINVRISKLLELRAQLEREDAAGTPRKRKTPKKRTQSVVEESNDDEGEHDSDEDEEDDFEVTPKKRQPRKQAKIPKRNSPRKKQRVNYAQSQDISEV